MLTLEVYISSFMLYSIWFGTNTINMNLCLCTLAFVLLVVGKSWFHVQKLTSHTFYRHQRNYMYVFKFNFSGAASGQSHGKKYHVISNTRVNYDHLCFFNYLFSINGIASTANWIKGRTFPIVWLNILPGSVAQSSTLLYGSWLAFTKHRVTRRK